MPGIASPNMDPLPQLSPEEQELKQKKARQLMLEDLRQKGANVLEFDPNAAYLIVFDHEKIRPADVEKIIGVLNDRGITADAAMVWGEPAKSVALYKYAPTLEETA